MEHGHIVEIDITGKKVGRCILYGFKKNLILRQPCDFQMKLLVGTGISGQVSGSKHFSLQFRQLPQLFNISLFGVGTGKDNGL